MSTQNKRKKYSQDFILYQIKPFLIFFPMATTLRRQTNIQAIVFDGMKHLDFVRGDGESVPSKRAKGMWSIEKEYVPFTDIFTCNGAVENYLCDLERQM